MGKNITTSAQFLLQTTGASTAATHPFLLIHYIIVFALILAARAHHDVANWRIPWD